MAVITVKGVSADDVRRQQWADKAGDAARAERAARLAGLEARESYIRAASDFFINERDAGTRADDVVIRTGAIKHPDSVQVDRDADPALWPQRAAENPGALARVRAQNKDARPPLSRLINRKGAALHLEVSVLAIANFRSPVGRRVDVTDLRNTGRHSWAVALADPSRSEPARRHVTDGLRRLHDEQLLGLKGRHGTSYQLFRDWELWCEDGSRDPYTVPDVGVRLSADFFTRGWSNVLTGPEIVAFLMFRHLSVQYSVKHANDGIGAAPAKREQVFGITQGIYACANELEEFGLIERTTERQPGKVKPGDQREVDRFKVIPGAFGRDAFDTVRKVLADKPTPARMARFDPLAGLEEFMLDTQAAQAAPGAVPAQAPGATASSPPLRNFD